VASRSIAIVADRFDRGALLAAVLVMAAWHVLAILPDGVLRWSVDVPLTYGAAVWLVYAVIGVVIAIVVLRGGGQGPALGLALIPVLFLGVVVVALTTPSGSFFDRYNWPFTSVGWFALILLWRRPVRDLLLFFAANTVIGLALMLDFGESDQVSLARFIVLAYSVCAIEVTLLIGGRALAAIARGAAAAQDDAARQVTKRLAAEAVQKSRRERYAMVQRTVAELLAGMTSGDIDLTAPPTRQEIRVAVTRLRRLMIETDEVPDQLLYELRVCADEAENRGIEVDLQAPVGAIPPLSLEVRRALIEPIIEVLAATSTWARVTVVAAPDEVSVGAVADARVSALAAPAHHSVQASHDMAGGLLWAQARWSDPLPSRS
jgi:hypothetical protein